VKQGAKKTKKQKVVPLFAITTFFGAKKPYKNGDVAQTQLVEYLVLLIVKGYIALSIVESL
jgi:hypothetical protein